jgi:SWI/SNF-related matrix-associated actin-dependent regulator 1 of chromatin subfamily A
LTSPTLQHLQPPAAGRKTFGRLSLEKSGSLWRIEADPPVLELMKRIHPACRDTDGVVRVPLSDRAIESLAWFMLKYPLKVEARSQAKWSECVKSAEKMVLRREGLTPAESIVQPSTIRGTLLEFQREDVATMARAKRIVNGCATGAGKTVEALATLAYTSAYPALLVVKPNVLAQWERMIETWLVPPRPAGLPPGIAVAPRASFQRLQGLKPGGIPQKPIIILHYLLLHAWRRELAEYGFRTIVFDECQELRNPESLKYAAAAMIAREAEYVFGLSATPIYGYGAEAHSVWSVIEPGCLGTTESFQEEWCHKYDKRRVREPEQLGDYLRSQELFFIRSADEIKSKLPPKRRITWAVESDKKVYESLIGEARRLAKSYESLGYLQRGQAKQKIGAKSRLAAGVAKVDAVAEFVRGLLLDGNKILLTAHHHQVHEALKRHFGARLVRCTGLESVKERQASMAAFLEGRADIFLLANRMGDGLDGLQARATCVVIAEFDFSPQLHSQIEDRVWRRGLKLSTEVPCYYPYSPAHYDSIMMEILDLKVGQFSGLMGQAETGPAPDEFTAPHIDRLIKLLKADPTP